MTCRSRSYTAGTSRSSASAVPQWLPRSAVLSHAVGGSAATWSCTAQRSFRSATTEPPWNPHRRATSEGCIEGLHRRATSKGYILIDAGTEISETPPLLGHTGTIIVRCPAENRMLSFRCSSMDEHREWFNQITAVIEGAVNF